MPSGDPFATTRSALREARTLLAAGLDPWQGESPLPPGTVFGDYELIEKLDRGATCFVYRARHAGIRRTVALKVMSNPEGVPDVEVLRFREGAAAAAELDHPNIVPVFHVGDHEGRPFFTMRLLEGGPLSNAMARLRQSPVEAARLMAKVARAVHFAHAARILHRDLKPANILLDERGEPYVADFGLAKRLDRASLTTQSRSFLVGTLPYMAPEQARGQSRELTAAADIFSLGAIFYELLTGQSPYEGLPPAALLNELMGPAPVRPPRAIQPGVPRSFENICLRCLEKDPLRRYRSADELAGDLEQACGGRAIRAPVSSLVRAARWARRHPRLSSALAGGLLLAAAVAGLWRADQARRRDALDTNAFIATGQAGAALFQLNEYAVRAAQAAEEPAVRSLLLREGISPAAPELRARLGTFDTLALLDTEGRIHAQWPPPESHVWGRSYAFRDYFQGARRLFGSGRAGAFLAPAFRSESHQRLEFAFSAPVRDDGGAELGVLLATLRASSVFGAVRMADSAQGARITTALIGPRGRDRNSLPADPRQSDLTFLVHPGLDRGGEYRLPAPVASALRAAFRAAAAPGQQFSLRYDPPVRAPDFRDPVPGFEGDWLAAFAPVGTTGYVVLVETRAGGILQRALGLIR